MVAVEEDDGVTAETGTDDPDVATVVVFGLDEAELHAAVHRSNMTVPAA